MNHTQLNDQLTRLDEAGLIRLLDDIGRTYGFRHALIQDSAYESTLRSNRQLLHQQVARAYEQSYAERSGEFAALIAHHYAQAGNHAQTVKYATLAGDAAMQRYAYPEARVNYALARRDDNLLVDGHALRLWARILAARGPEYIAGAFTQLKAGLRVFEAAEATIEIAHTRAMWNQLCGVWPAIVDGL